MSSVLAKSANTEGRSPWILSRERLGGTDAREGLGFGDVFTISKNHRCTACAGPIPEALGALSKLKVLGLSGNELTGEERVNFPSHSQISVDCIRV